MRIIVTIYILSAIWQVLVITKNMKDKPTFSYSVYFNYMSKIKLVHSKKKKRLILQF